jgi:hypothetical protein
MDGEIINGKKYYFAQATKEGIEELIRFGLPFFFQFRGNDYFIERGGNGYLIQDPQVTINGDLNSGLDYTDYPGHKKAKTPEELMALPFLDGKTIFERFDELKFFDI